MFGFSNTHSYEIMADKVVQQVQVFLTNPIILAGLVGVGVHYGLSKNASLLRKADGSEYAKEVTPVTVAVLSGVLAYAYQSGLIAKYLPQKSQIGRAHD